VFNPANDTVLGKVAMGTAEDVDAAVKAARAAFGKWSKLTGHEWARYLYAIARHIQKRDRFFSVLETWTMASLSAKPATSTFRWWLIIFC
jgi:aldehyde dehydrogenase (NAD+)